MKARDPGRRDATGKVLKDRRSPRRRGRMGTSVVNAPGVFFLPSSSYSPAVHVHERDEVEVDLRLERRDVGLPGRDPRSERGREGAVDVRRARGGRGEDPRERTKKKKRKERRGRGGRGIDAMRSDATRRDAPRARPRCRRRFPSTPPSPPGSFLSLLPKKDAKYDPGARRRIFPRCYLRGGFGGSTRFGQMKNASPSSVTPEVRWGERQTERTRPGRRKSFSIDVQRAREAVWEVVSRTDGVQHADRPARVADRLTHVVHLLG